METGNNYTIADIFSGNKKVVIPDLQREYCWPSEYSDVNGKDLVTHFVSRLLELDDNNRKMGLIYAYEPILDNIYLCDGQQRITTLYLLVGYLYHELKKQTGEDDKLLNEAHELLISKFEEEKDDKEPRLQYSIRESTLFFLRDLVNQYFLGEDVDIKESSWYFSDYDNDPSIHNIIKALEKFEKAVKKDQMIELLNVVMHRIQFMYFDMKSRSYGEEQYVVINTTGKPLTVSENYKPRFMDGLSGEKFIDGKREIQYYADQWEDWEAFFWKFHPQEDGAYVVDQAMKEFFKWIFIIEKYDQNESLDVLDKDSPFDIFDLVNDIPEPEDKSERVKKLFQIIKEYYNVVVILNKLKCTIHSIYEQRTTLNLNFNNLIDNYFRGVVDGNKINYIHLIPLIAYLRFSKKKDVDTDLTRMIRFLINRSEDPDVVRNPSSMILEAIKFIRNCTNFTPTDGISMTGISKIFLKQTELDKMSLLERDYKQHLNSANVLTDLENSLWKAECMNIFRGDISQLFIMIGINFNSVMTINSIIIDKAIQLVKESVNKCDDMFRRALLTYGDYSLDTNWAYSIEAQKAQFARTVEELRRIYLSNDNRIWSNIIIPFMKDLFNSNEDAWTFENQRINEYKLLTEPDGTCSHKSIFFYKLIKNYEYFDFMRSKCYAYKDDRYWLLKGTRANTTNDSSNPELDYSIPDETK